MNTHSIDKSIFREYDIRGIYGENLTQESVFAIGYALGRHVLAVGEGSIAIGYDARTHSPILYEWLRDGFCASGVKVYFLGLIPTPVAYFSTFTSTHTQSSVMITGSHNPPQYNGFKITIAKKPFYGKQIQELGWRIMASDAKALLRLSYVSHAQALSTLQEYHQFLIEHFAALKGFPYHVAFDYGNGVGAVGLEPVLDALEIPHTSLFATPDGNFPNHHPDPSEEHNLRDIKAMMKEQHIPLGIAFDGDADRVALMSENHHYKGDELAILFARDMAKHIAKPIVIGEVKCSQLMYDEINRIGKAVMYKTGHSNLKTKLQELNGHLAAEMSGHLFFNDRYFGYDDALYGALRALELFLHASPSDVESTISTLPTLYSTDEEKIATTEEQKFSHITALHSALTAPPEHFPRICDLITIDGIRIVFDEGWALVRASNTTPVLVTRFEATSQALLEHYKHCVLELLHSVMKH